MKVEIWKPTITNQKLIGSWKEVFNRLYPGGYEFETFLKRDSEEIDYYIVVSFSQNRKEYYDRLRETGTSSFDQDLNETIIGTDEEYGDYSLAVNKYAFVRGAMVLVHNEEVSMHDSDVESDLRTWSEIAREKKLRIYSNFPGIGASIEERQHAQAYPFRVPLEYFLRDIRDNRMEGYPGKNLVCSYTYIDRLVDKVCQLRGQGTPPNTFVIEDKVGCIERTTSEDASRYFGGAHPSGSTIMGIVEAGNLENFNQLRSTPFEQDWGHITRVLLPKN